MSTVSPTSIITVIEQFNWLDPVGSIDSLIEGEINKLLPAGAAWLQPEVGNLEIAAMGIANKIVRKYVLAKAAALLAPELTKIEADIPAAKPVIDRILAVLNA